MSRTIAVSTDWKPRKRGKRYCSPACGRGCTVIEHQKAKKAAERLVKRLGDRWTARIWENLGWHYELVMGGIRLDEYWVTIDQRRVREYQATFGNSAELRVEASSPEAALEGLDMALMTAMHTLQMGSRMIRQSRREARA